MSQLRLSTGELLTPLKGAMPDYPQVEQPFRAISDEDISTLNDGKTNFYLDAYSCVVTFGGTKRNYHLMPVDQRLAKKVLTENDLDFDDAMPDQPFSTVWIPQLKVLFSEYETAVADYSSALSKLKRFHRVSDSLASPNRSMNEMFDAWLEGVCKQWNSRVSNRSNLSLSTAMLPDELRYSGLSHAYDKTIAQCRDIILDNYDFDALEKTLNVLSKGLEERGFNQAADNLAHNFDFIENGWRRGSDTKIIKSVGGRVVFEMHRYDNNGSTMRGHRMSAETFENETGVDGLAYCVDSLISEESLCGSGKRPASHTKTAVGTDCFAVIFKEKYRFHMTEALFESLAGFIVQYTTKDIKDLTF